MTEQPIMNFHIQGDNHVYPTAAVVNNYFGQAVCESAMKMNFAQSNKEQQPNEEAPDELLAILKDKEMYDEVVTWAKTCKHPKDIRNRICSYLKGKGFTDFSFSFIKALLPHLVQYEGSKDIENIQRQLY